MIKVLEGRNCTNLYIGNKNNIKFNYPVTGTLVVNNNKISFTLDSNMKDNEIIKIIGWGNYNLSMKEYHYGYFNFKKMTDNGKDIKVNKSLPWKGMRKYNVTLKNSKLVLISKQRKQTWSLDKESLLYTDKEWEDKKRSHKVLEKNEFIMIMKKVLCLIIYIFSFKFIFF